MFTDDDAATAEVAAVGGRRGLQSGSIKKDVKVEVKKNVEVKKKVDVKKSGTFSYKGPFKTVDVK